MLNIKINYVSQRPQVIQKNEQNPLKTKKHLNFGINVDETLFLQQVKASKNIYFKDYLGFFEGFFALLKEGFTIKTSLGKQKFKGLNSLKKIGNTDVSNWTIKLDAKIPEGGAYNIKYLGKLIDAEGKPISNCEAVLNEAFASKSWPHYICGVEQKPLNEKKQCAIEELEEDYYHLFPQSNITIQKIINNLMAELQQPKQRVKQLS